MIRLLICSLAVLCIAPGAFTQQPSLRISESPVLILGLDDNEVTFGNIAGAGRDVHGDIILADRGANAVYRYDLESARLHTLARSGRGPNELSGFWTMARLRNTSNEIIITHIGAGRVEIRSKDDESEEGYVLSNTAEIRTPEGRIPTSVFKLDDGRRLIALTAPRRGADGEETTVKIGLLDDEWNIKNDSIFELHEGPQTYVFSTDDGSVSMVEVPFGINSFFEILPDGSLLRMNSHEFVVHHVSADGIARTLIEENLKAEPITAAEMREIRSDYSVWPEAGPMLDLIPETKPLVTQLFRDIDNRLWILYAQHDEKRANVYSLDGKKLFSLPVPDEYSIRDARNDELLLQYTGEDDFPHLKLVNFYPE